jgi:hypothetical protein
MLEPEIGALAICGVWPAEAFELHELYVLIAELHRQHFHWPGWQAQQGIQGCVFQAPPTENAEVEDIMEETLRAVEIGDGKTDCPQGQHACKGTRSRQEEESQHEARAKGGYSERQRLMHHPIPPQ